MAMFVLVVDTSLMNVSISAVVQDLGTTVSGVQSAIALEALVSAAFILIGGKVGDLIGRKRAYVLGLLGYAVGAVAMTLAQSLVAIIVFWAVIGGLGASLLLPVDAVAHPRQLRGRGPQARSTPWSGAAAAIAAAVGPLLGGFITTYLSWRVAFLLEAVVIAIVLSGIGLVRDVPYTGPRGVDVVGAALSVVGMGGIVLGILVWQEGGEAVLALIALGRGGDGRPGVVAGAAASAGAGPPCSTPTCSARPRSGSGSPQQMLQQIALGGTMIALPIFLQIVLEYDAMRAGLSLAPLSLSMFAVAPWWPGRRPAGAARARIIRARVRPGRARPRGSAPDRAARRLGLGPRCFRSPSPGSASASSCRSSTTTRWPRSRDERVSEAAGVNSAAGSFGLSFGLAFAGAILLATLSIAFTSMAEDSSVLAPDEQQQVADVLEEDAEVMSNTQLDELLDGQPEDVQDEILRINTDARPLALQVALAVPILAALLGLANSFRMVRLPDPEPAGGGRGAHGARVGGVGRRGVAPWSVAEGHAQRHDGERRRRRGRGGERPADRRLRGGGRRRPRTPMPSELEDRDDDRATRALVGQSRRPVRARARSPGAPSRRGSGCRRPRPGRPRCRPRGASCSDVPPRISANRWAIHVATPDPGHQLGAVAQCHLRHADDAERGEDEDGAVGGRAHQLREPLAGDLTMVFARSPHGGSATAWRRRGRMRRRSTFPTSASTK